jgi:hypothetical protein
VLDGGSSTELSAAMGSTVAAPPVLQRWAKPDTAWVGSKASFLQLLEGGHRTSNAGSGQVGVTPAHLLSSSTSWNSPRRSITAAAGEQAKWQATAMSMHVYATRGPAEAAQAEAAQGWAWRPSSRWSLLLANTQNKRTPTHLRSLQWPRTGRLLGRHQSGCD